MEGETWGSWWNDQTGFSYEAFIKKYMRRKPRLLGTRRVLQRFRDNGINCVETNVYRNEGSPRDNDGGVLNVDVLVLLLEHMPKLRAAVICGGVARKVIEQHPGLRGRLSDCEAKGMIRIDVDRLYCVADEWVDATCDRVKANRLVTCPQCGSSSASECKDG